MDNPTRTLTIGGVSYNFEDALNDHIIEVEENGFFAVDKNLNIGFSVDAVYSKQQIDRILGKDTETMNTAYEGARISLNKAYRYNQTQLFQLRATLTQGRQGAAIYGDTLFQFYQGTKSVELYNMATMAYVKAIQRSDTVASDNHAGTASFGKAKYADTDVFPLLYVSDMGLDSTMCKIYVYRVIATSTVPTGVTGLTLVQTITLPNYTGGSPYLPDAAVDPESNKLIVWGYSRESRENAVVDDNPNYIQIRVCDLPSVSAGNVTITSDAYQVSHQIPFHWGVQDGCIRNGMLYLVYGLYPDHEAGIIALDYGTGIVKTHVPLDVGTRFEPEGFDIYNNSFIMTTYKGASGYAYRFEFD